MDPIHTLIKQSGSILEVKRSKKLLDRGEM